MRKASGLLNKKSEDKMKKLLGKEVDPRRDSYIPGQTKRQPAHVKNYKINRLLGQQIQLRKSADDMEDQPNSDMARRKRNRRVQKFFGETFDVETTAYLERLNVTPVPSRKLKRQNSKGSQPPHVDARKLNNFFGRHTPIVRSTLREDDDTEREKAYLKSRRSKKLRRLFGEHFNEIECKRIAFAEQPYHVKVYKLNKYFFGGGAPITYKHFGKKSREYEDLYVSKSLRLKRRLHHFFGETIQHEVVVDEDDLEEDSESETQMLRSRSFSDSVIDC